MREPNINSCAKEQIEVIKTKCERIKPLVVVRCITFNHEVYIRDALDGFIIQKTDFPFVAVVHDDASTDKTAEIIKEYAEKYPDIIMPIFEIENQHSKHDGSLGRIINMACEVTGAKYIAMCEGDDYWTDPLKIQKQVDFLESHPDYGMCYTKVKQYNQNHNIFLDIWGGPNEKFEELLLNNTIPTLSVLLKREIYEKYYLEINPGSHKDWLMGDYPLWLYVVKKSKIYFLDEVTGVYRILQNSASHSDDSSKELLFGLNSRLIAIFFSVKYRNFIGQNVYQKVMEDYVWYSILYQSFKYNNLETSFIKENMSIIKGFRGKRFPIKFLLNFPKLIVFLYKNNLIIKKYLKNVLKTVSVHW